MVKVQKQRMNDYKNGLEPSVLVMLNTVGIDCIDHTNTVFEGNCHPFYRNVLGEHQSKSQAQYQLYRILFCRLWKTWGDTYTQETVPLEPEVCCYLALAFQMVLMKVVLVLFGIPLQKTLALIFTTYLVRKLQLLKEESHTEWGLVYKDKIIHSQNFLLKDLSNCP